VIVRDRRELRRRLVAVASVQSGYFSAAQAREAGYSYQAQKQNADRGNWLKVGRGIFRLPEWPAGRAEDLVRLALWSHGRAVVSHESALSVHELGDVNPARTHLTVPPGFRQRAPRGVALHRAELPAADVREQEGYRVTTPLRSLLDAAAGDLDLDLLAGTIEDAMEQGLVTRAALLARADQLGPNAALRIERALAGRRGGGG
jgi:predicted transcriptional regulator of viral defense system